MYCASESHTATRYDGALPRAEAFQNRRIRFRSVEESKRTQSPGILLDPCRLPHAMQVVLTRQRFIDLLVGCQQAGGEIPPRNTPMRCSRAGRHVNAQMGAAEAADSDGKYARTNKSRTVPLNRNRFRNTGDRGIAQKDSRVVWRLRYGDDFYLIKMLSSSSGRRTIDYRHYILLNNSISMATSTIYFSACVYLKNEKNEWKSRRPCLRL